MTEKTKRTIGKVTWKAFEILAEAGLVVAAAMLGAEVTGNKVRESLSETISELKSEA